MIAKDLDRKIMEAEYKAWQSLSGYKFIMFGYWAAIWVHLNKMKAKPLDNPFRDLIQIAKRKLK